MTPLTLRSAAALSIVVLLPACGGQPSGPAPAAPSPAPPAAEAASGPPVRGVVVKSATSFALRECGAPAGRSVNLIDPGGELSKAFVALDAPPADGIYVELYGNRSTDGGSLTLSQLARARGLGAGLACEPPVFEGDYVASGNEPFWSVEIREDGIRFRSPDESKGRRYPYAITRTETGATLYATKIEKPRVSTLEVSLEPGRCVDSMSGELRAFTAHVVVDGKKLDGCAAAGVPPGSFGNAPLDELQRWAGSYPTAAMPWEASWLRPRLEALLGAKLKAFQENLQVRTPVMNDGGVFYVTGNKAHQGGLDNALFIADPDSDTIEVILVVGGVREDFKEGGRDVALPAEVVTTLGNLPAR
jgi:uncharacterized membrane protein